MSTGIVKFFDSTKGFGFIVADDQSGEYFVHASNLQGVSSLEEKQAVSYEIEEGKKGPMAVNVSVID